MTTVASSQKKYLTMSELDRTDKGPVYAINNLTDDYRGMIIIPVARKSGNGHDIVRVPPTFIPVDLTEQIVREQLLSSTEFRQAVSKGLLRLVTDDYARRVLATEEAQVELDRVAQNMSRARAMVEALPLNAGTTKSKMVKDIETEGDELESVRAKAKAQPSSKAVQLVTKALTEHEEVPLIMANLRNFTNMRLPDMNYVLSKLGHFAKVKQYMEKEIQKRKAYLERKKRG